MLRRGLYVHVPFCETKCGYCDFYSIATVGGRPTGPLLDRLLTELRTRTCARRKPFDTIFVGGGTPTILPPEQLSCISRALKTIALQDGCNEFTVEANPATVDDAKLHILVDAGMNRVSFGAQSFHPSELAALERLHSPDDIAPGVAAARRHGIRRINLDLMFAIPGQTLTSWQESLDRAIALEVDHLACYGLTYEPGTRLTRQLRHGRIAPCDDDLAADMYEFAIDHLAAAGYEQYEISNFARPDQACQHNLIYWRNEEYIGVGPSAASFIDSERSRNVPDITRYIRMIDADGTAVVESERLRGLAAAADTLLTRMRLNAGIDGADFVARHGDDAWRRVGPVFERLALLGMIEVMAGAERHMPCYGLTRKGRLVADSVLAELIAALDMPGETGADLPLKIGLRQELERFASRPVHPAQRC